MIRLLKEMLVNNNPEKVFVFIQSRLSYDMEDRASLIEYKGDVDEVLVQLNRLGVNGTNITAVNKYGLNDILIDVLFEEDVDVELIEEEESVDMMNNNIGTTDLEKAIWEDDNQDVIDSVDTISDLYCLVDVTNNTREQALAIIKEEYHNNQMMIDDINYYYDMKEMDSMSNYVNASEMDEVFGMPSNDSARIAELEAEVQSLKDDIAMYIGVLAKEAEKQTKKELEYEERIKEMHKATAKDKALLADRHARLEKARAYYKESQKEITALKERLAKGLKMYNELLKENKELKNTAELVTYKQDVKKVEDSDDECREKDYDYHVKNGSLDSYYAQHEKEEMNDLFEQEKSTMGNNEEIIEEELKNILDESDMFFNLEKNIDLSSVTSISDYINKCNKVYKLADAKAYLRTSKNFKNRLNNIIELNKKAIKDRQQQALNNLKLI